MSRYISYITSKLGGILGRESAHRIQCPLATSSLYEKMEFSSGGNILLNSVPKISSLSAFSIRLVKY